jgi:hypothetical protein
VPRFKAYPSFFYWFLSYVQYYSVASASFKTDAPFFYGLQPFFSVYKKEPRLWPTKHCWLYAISCRFDWYRIPLSPTLFWPRNTFHGNLILAYTFLRSLMLFFGSGPPGGYISCIII